jgi:Tfp pilus assembly protein PilF
MKIKFLIAGLLGVVSVTAFAQKGELNNAQDAFEKAQSFRSANASAFSKKSLNDAKTAIDKAAANVKTAELPQTHALKAAIYADMSNQDTVAATSLPLYTAAEVAFAKAKELDTKGEYKGLIEVATLNLAQYKLNQGVNEYKDKKFDLAYNSFDRYRQYMPDDTNAIYYTGLAAVNLNNYPVAATHYNKLLTTNYSKNDLVYFELSNVYLNLKDTTAAIKAVNDGIAKYPANADLRKRQIEIYLKTGKQQEVLGQLDAAIKNDPKNKQLYYYAGITYSELAEEIKSQASKAKDAATKAKLTEQKAMNYTKAAEMYKKALELDPNYFEANLNLGYVLLSPAIDMYNSANKQKEFDAAVAKSSELFDLAKPYLLKAVDIDPKSTDALDNLRTYYLGKRDVTNANLIKAKIEALTK